MSSHAALVKTNVPEELIASIIAMPIIGKLGTTLAVTSNRNTEMSSGRRKKNVSSKQSSAGEGG
jgi:hypothetical protein